ncbi:MAG TPA: NAD(P)H-binding protein [Gaiellaceae bacterium]|nr:NAD(P)H-binding protein [Gaiellaceae bacterium]
MTVLPAGSTELDVVTGAFSFTGRHIAEALLARGRRVRTLTRRPDPSHPLAGRVEVAPLAFDDSLDESLRGADTLYNTYWVRFERGEATFDGAVRNTAALFGAAQRAGVRRIVHISVANPDAASPFPYFRGKARTEEALREAGVSHAIVRPTLVYGPDDILVNNIAWGLRHVPVFLIGGDGRSQVQPVSVSDTAALCVGTGARDDDVTLDAAGPDRWAYEDFVQLIRRAVRGRARIWHSPTGVALAAARFAGLLLRDVVVTRDELQALGAGLLVSHEPPAGSDRFETWLTTNADQLGRRYTSELGRNFRA